MKKSIRIIAAITCLCFLWQNAGFTADCLRQVQLVQQDTAGKPAAAVTVNASGIEDNGVSRTAWLAIGFTEMLAFGLIPYFLLTKQLSPLSALVTGILITTLPLIPLVVSARQRARIAHILSLTDHMTELPNRRAFEEYVDRAIARTQRSKEHRLALYMIDLDNFKSLNDKYGHVAGDAVLKRIAEILRDSGAVRHSDMVARWGGEEFAVLLDETATDKRPLTAGWFVSAANRILARVRADEELRKLTGDSPITVSIGIAEYQADEEWDLKTLVGHADRAFYWAKEDGKDRFVVDTHSPLSTNADAGAVGKNWIVMPDGARIHKTVVIGHDCIIKGKTTVIGAHAVIMNCSIISDARVGAGAYVDASVVKTVDNRKKWEYKEQSDLIVKSRRPTVVDAGAKIVKSVIYSSRIGRGTQVYESVAEHSDIGEENHFNKAKLSLVKTHEKVHVTWAEMSEGIFGFGFDYDGLKLGGPAYFEGVFNNSFSTALIPRKNLSDMTVEQVEKLVSDPQKLQAFVKRIKFRMIDGIPHVSKYMPYDIYSVFTGKNLPPQDGVLTAIRGEVGEQLSQHARIAIDPAVAVAANTDISPRILGRPDPRRPRKVMRNAEFTHQACFSLSGFGGPIVHGQIRPGTESHSLSPSRTRHLWTFTHCPGLIFEMMDKISNFLPAGQESKFDDLPIKTIETAFLMTLYDLSRVKNELRTAADLNDNGRMASLKRLEKNLTDALPVYLRNLDADKRYGIWHFRNGKPHRSWHKDERTGLWTNVKASMDYLSNEEPAVYRQYTISQVLELNTVKRRAKPAPVLSDKDLRAIYDSYKAEGGPAVEIEDTAVVGKNVNFSGNGRVIVEKGATLENCLVISDGEIIIGEGANISLTKIISSPDKKVHIGKNAVLDYTTDFCKSNRNDSSSMAAPRPECTTKGASENV